VSRAFVLKLSQGVWIDWVGIRLGTVNLLLGQVPLRLVWAGWNWDTLFTFITYNQSKEMKLRGNIYCEKD